MAYCAGKGGIRFGAEWGFSPQLACACHNNFKTEIGYRIDSRSIDLKYASNGYLDIYLGFNVSGHMMLSVLAGYEGITTQRRVFPLKLRATWCAAEQGKSGFVCFLESGIATHDFKPGALIIPAAVGGGYKHSLSGNVSINLLFKIKATYDQPGIVDKYYGRIPAEDIIVNDVLYLAPSIGLGINF